jgi:hypothetical protein
MAKKAISSLLPSAGGNTVGGKSNSGVGGQNVSEDWTLFGKRQILSVGSKKRHRHHDDDDDEILAVDVAAGGDGSSSDEEDQGRTSAVREKKRRIQPPPVVSTAIAGTAASAYANDEASADVAASASAAPSKKKKKKGKKERIKEGSPELSKEETVATDLPANVKLDDVDDDAGENDARNRDGDPKIEVDTSDKKKRWKKKVRSRQKNIRKDHRAMADRPPHVVLGGRPLTEATRQKLGLQTTTTTNADSTIDPSSLIDVAFDSGKWVGDGGETAHSANGGERGGANSSKEDTPKTSARRTTLTKVGDCIVDVEAISERSNKEEKNNNKEKIEGKSPNKKKGKTQKRKFKNIALG